jgi:hypothetical protein
VVHVEILHYEEIDDCLASCQICGSLIVGEGFVASVIRLPVYLRGVSFWIWLASVRAIEYTVSRISITPE